MPVTWNAVQAVYAPDPQEHLARAQALGLNCPLDVLEQLFTDHHDEPEFAKIVAFVDWSGVEWEEARLSGVALRRVGVPRAYQYAVDEARARTAEEGFQDEREEVTQHWLATKTWIRAPIVLAGEVCSRRCSTSSWWDLRGSAICWVRSIGRMCRRLRSMRRG